MYRMVIAAITLPDTILLELERLQIPSSYIHENKFFVANGVDKQSGPQMLHGQGRVPAPPRRSGPRPRGVGGGPGPRVDGPAAWCRPHGGPCAGGGRGAQRCVLLLACRPRRQGNACRTRTACRPSSCWQTTWRRGWG